MRLTTDELSMITGGASGWVYGLIAGVGALITFVAGLIDGYINPLKCNMGKKK